MIDYMIMALGIYLTGRVLWECVKLLIILLIGSVVYISSGGKTWIVRTNKRNLDNE